MGWPVSLCSTGTHWVSRYDDGKAAYIIECSKIDNSGFFSADPDSYYIERFKLPMRALRCGSELRKLTAREMLGAALARSARHHVDVRKWQRADSDYSLARHLFPNHRQTHMRACATMVKLSANIFEPHETGHMNSFFEDLCPQMAPDVYERREQLYARAPVSTGMQYANPFAGHYPQTVVDAGH
jgi:hypothetical protein